MDEIKPTPRNKLTGLLADALQGGLEFATNNGKNKPMNMLADLFGVNDVQKGAERLSYGGALTTGSGLNTRLHPEIGNAILSLLPFAGSMGRGAKTTTQLLGEGLRTLKGSEALPALSKASPMADRGAITYHASPVKLDLKDRYGKGYDELYDKVNNFDGSADEFLKWQTFLKKYEGGGLGNNAGKKADQLYVSNQPDAWKSVQMDELNVPYDLGGVYGLEVKKAPEYYMQKSGMGQQLPEAVIDAKDVLNQFGPFKNKAELDKHLASIGKLDGVKTVSNGNERLLKILERNGESVAPKFEYPAGDRFALAQQRAALPLPPAGVDITKLPQSEARKYGLGLRADNTALERANASKDANSIFDMNFNNDAYHGGSSNIEKFMPNGGKEGSEEFLKSYRDRFNKNLPVGYMDFRGGSFFSPETKTASGYAESIGENGAIYPVKLASNMPLHLQNEGFKLKQIGDKPIGTIDSLNIHRGGNLEEISIIEPDNIRSRFAAFDPWRRNAAIAATMGVAAPDLLANPLDDKNNRLIDILRNK